MDLRAVWNMDEPAESRQRFLALLDSNVNDRLRLEIQAQVARSFGLEGAFEEAHRHLDLHWNEAMLVDDRAKACFWLERGRAFRSAGQKAKAISCFESALSTDVLDLKIDALHMLALVFEGAESDKFHAEGLRLALEATDPRARRWAATFYNNMGWNAFDLEDFNTAIRHFAQALEVRKWAVQEGLNKPKELLVAHWCVARAHRALGQHEAAIVRLIHALDLGVTTYEEMAENELAAGRPRVASAWATLALQKIPIADAAQHERMNVIQMLSV